MTDMVWNIIVSAALFGLFIYFVITGAPLEQSLPSIFLLFIAVADGKMRMLGAELSELRNMILKTRTDTRSLVIKYFARLINFLQATDILKEMYVDGLLFDPSFSAEDGKLTKNLPNGTALIVKDAGYPEDIPGVYVNLRLPNGNEHCVIRAEFNKENGLRVIAYQCGKDEAAIDITHIPDYDGQV